MAGFHAGYFSASVKRNASLSLILVFFGVLLFLLVGLRSPKPEQVFYSGAVLGESAVTTEELIGSKIELNYGVRNHNSTHRCISYFKAKRKAKCVRLMLSSLSAATTLTAVTN